MSNHNELASFKQLLRQVYSAHSTKVKELENEIKTLKEKLTEKERENNSRLSESKRCVELEEAFKSCKKALYDQSKLFENFGQKFSIFSSPTLESQDLKIAKLSSHSQKKIHNSTNDGSTYRNESDIQADESTITELKINENKNFALINKNFSEKTIHDDDNSESFDLYTVKLDVKSNEHSISDNQKLFKKVMNDDENLDSFDVCTITFPQQLKQDRLNEKCDSLILAPDSLETSLDPKIVHEKKCSPSKESISCKTSNSTDQKKNSLKCDRGKVSNKRQASDTLSDKVCKRSNICQTENKSKIVKASDTEICNIIPPKVVVTRDNSNLPVKTDTKITEKNLDLASDKKIVTKHVSNDKVIKNQTPKNPNFLKNLKESKLSEISPSLLPTNVNIPLKIIATEVSNDDDFQDQVSCSRSNQSEDSWDACDKKNPIKKKKAIKSIKTTSKFKMTLDAPPLNYKKPSYKQTKLSKSLFQAKGSASKKSPNRTSHTKKSDFVTIEDDSSPVLQDYFQTSTPFDAAVKSPFNVDIDATFIPENYQPEETATVKKNAVEKSHLKNGNLFSSISFPKKLDIVEKKDGNTGKENDFENYSFSEELESKENMDSFDKLPLPEEPNYKYKNDVVRKKSERKQLNAFDCKECEKYYSELGLSDKEKKERMKKCSRHRAKYTPPSTPDHFWELEFPDTLECKARGYMNETQKVKLNNICNI